MSVEASCHCGSVRMALAVAPETVTDCNCSICRRYGVLWAYYEPGSVDFLAPTGPTDTYEWGDRMLTFHRCRTCGCITHWADRDPSYDRMGVNARLLPLDVLSAAQVLHLDRV
ncbi:MAG: GFA family protein [Alphaproteobacteria bacterium]